MSDLFEHLAAIDDSAIIAHRKASAVATKRVKDRFGAFLANARDRSELSARLALVQDDLHQVINDVVTEYGGDAQRIAAAIKQSMMPIPGSGASDMSTMPAQPQGQGQGTCPQCGGPMTNGQCATCQGGVGAGVPGAGGVPGAYGLNHTMPQSPSSGPVMAAGAFCDECRGWKSGPNKSCTCGGGSEGSDSEDSEGGEAAEESKESSVREARRPKMCPYHSEVVDISLGAGDPQAGYHAMSSHAWGDRHCKGGYEGTCNFRPAMVTQKHWDDKQQEYADRRQQRDQQRADVPELSIDTEPIMHAEPLPDEPGEEGVTDVDGELANAPSAVGAGELAMAAHTKRGEALTTVDLPKADPSGFGGPSPKIDKAKSGDQAGWFLDPIDTDMDGTPNPTLEQDPTDKADYNKEEFLDQTKAVTKSETLPTSTNADDAGFNTGRDIKQYPTDTFGDNGTNPVTRESLSARYANQWIQQRGGKYVIVQKGTGKVLSEHDSQDKAQQSFEAMEAHKHARGPGEGPPCPHCGGSTRYGNGNYFVCPGCNSKIDKTQPEAHPLPAAIPQGDFSHEVLGAVDPDKNPIRELVETFREGWLPALTIDQALNGFADG